MISFKLVISMFIAALSCTATAEWAQPHSWCPKYSGVVFSEAAHSASGLQHTVARFRKELGGDDNGSGPGLSHGHRSINWDAPIVPFRMPGNFFKTTVTRGAEFLAVDGAFAVSNPSDTDPSHVVDDRFSSFHPAFATLFQTFSPKRLFTPVKSNHVTVVFSVPASKFADKATVSGFGAIFTNVYKKDKTFLHFYDENECLIFRQRVKDLSRGLSFGGIVVTHKNGRPVRAAIASVKVVLGDGIISQPKSRKNFVVLDDLIYGEPQKLPY